eukprot:Colp12_sorted_trinity150504_noHs@1737
MLSARRLASARAAIKLQPRPILTSRTYSESPRWNPYNIQLLPEKIWKHVFRNAKTEGSGVARPEVKNHLAAYGLWDKKPDVLPPINLELPEFAKNATNLAEHFYVIAEQQAGPYRKRAEALISSSLPPRPTKWKLKPGWTRYADGSVTSVERPLEQDLVFDVEVCMQEGKHPTLAV